MDISRGKSEVALWPPNNHKHTCDDDALISEQSLCLSVYVSLSLYIARDTMLSEIENRL